MLNLRYRPFWIAASAVLVLGVVWGSLQSAFGGAVPQGFDKVEHFGTYMFLADWFTGLLPRPRWWHRRGNAAGLGFAMEVGQYVMQSGRTADPTTWRRTPRASLPDCCWPLLLTGGWTQRIESWLAGSALPPARRPHAAREPRRVHRPVAPARAGQTAAPPARRPQPALDDPVGPARHRQDHARAPGREDLRLRVPRAVGGDGWRQGRACRRRAGAADARGQWSAHRALPGRSASLQQVAAGCLPAVRRGRHPLLHRRHDRESVVRDQQRVAVPCPRVRAAFAYVDDIQQVLRRALEREFSSGAEAVKADDEAIATLAGPRTAMHAAH